jgi:ComF family protein
MRVDAYLRHLPVLLWPPRCVLCSGPGQPPALDLCERCESELPVNDRCCPRCAESLAAESDAPLCGACLRQPPHFDVCIAPFRYAYPLDFMIRAFKYGGEIAYGRVLGDAFARKVGSGPPELLLPVPLGRKRFAQRGYNQATELAMRWSQHFGISLRTDVLVRTRDTAEQAGLDRKARRRNLRKAFALTAPVRARHVALVDDVVTTGSTANEIARLLRRAGVARVEIWAIARAARQPGGG